MSFNPNNTNPYQSPATASRHEAKRKNEKQYAPCPGCNNVFAKRVGFTLWGGALGPALLTHVKCDDCGTTYNGKTGKSNNTAIAIYLGISVVIGLVVGVILIMNRK